MQRLFRRLLFVRLLRRRRQPASRTLARCARCGLAFEGTRDERMRVEEARRDHERACPRLSTDSEDHTVRWLTHRRLTTG